jgi:L-amino acid N-acyltransferase YncA
VGPVTDVGQDGVVIRDANAADAGRCAAIYAPYVRDTAISFESEPPAVTEMAGRIAEAQRAHAWLVLEIDSEVVGYAYGGPFMSRAAYQWASAVSVYMDGERHRSGGGRALYEALFDRLAARGHRTALAGIALPNEASVGLHRALGFELAGTYRRVGWKLGRWHDVAWYQRPLGDGDDGPPEPLH